MKYTEQELAQHESHVAILKESIHTVMDSVLAECPEFSAADVLGAYVNALLDTLRACRFAEVIDDDGIESVLERLLFMATEPDRDATKVIN